MNHGNIGDKVHCTYSSIIHVFKFQRHNLSNFSLIGNIPRHDNCFTKWQLATYYGYFPFEKYLVDWKIIIVQTFESKWKTDGGDAAVVIWAKTEWHWRSEVKDTPNDNSLPAKPGYF